MTVIKIIKKGLFFSFILQKRNKVKYVSFLTEVGLILLLKNINCPYRVKSNSLVFGKKS